MPTDHTMRERHGCIVCGQTYLVYVSYDEEANFLHYSATDPSARVLPHPGRPVVVCLSHSGPEVAAALAAVLAEDDDDHDHDHDDDDDFEAGHHGHHH